MKRGHYALAVFQYIGKIWPLSVQRSVKVLVSEWEGADDLGGKINGDWIRGRS